MTDLSKQADTLGYPAFVPSRSDGRRYLHNQRLGRVLVKDQKRVSTRYLYYLMCCKWYRDEILASATGTTVKHTSPERIKRFRFQLPPLDQQRAIAHILGTIDDKIELNRRMNETLESIARAIFKSWFVDYCPVRAKADGRQPAGMDAETAALFPNSFEDSPMGKIPRGWHIGSVSELCTSIENGGTPSRKIADYWHEGIIDWFKTGELTDGPLIHSDERITEKGLSESSCKLWEPGTVLVALYASPTVGRLGLLDARATANQACSALVAKPEYGNLLIFYSLMFTRDVLQNIAVGAAQQNISQKVVREHPVLVPGKDIAGRFQKRAEPLHRDMSSNLVQNLTLVGIRDTFLPKLISGEIRVKGAEKLVEEHAG